jgi:hypothetical protein
MGRIMDENKETIEENPNEENSQDSGIPAKKDMKHLDFATSLVIMGVSVYTFYQSYGFYTRSRKAFYASPGFMPAIIAGALFLLGIYLLYQSLNKSSLKELFGRLGEAIPRGLKSARFKNTIIGLAIFGLYIFVLLRYLPFWLASVILLFGCFIYLKAAKIIKSAVIAILSAVGIVLLFQVIFRVPMP